MRGGRNVENQNIERSERWKYFLDDQNVESQKIRTSKAFDVLIFLDAIGNIRTSKVFWATTYGILPMCTKACGGLG